MPTGSGVRRLPRRGARHQRRVSALSAIDQPVALVPLNNTICAPVEFGSGGPGGTGGGAGRDRSGACCGCPPTDPLRELRGLLVHRLLCACRPAVRTACSRSLRRRWSGKRRTCGSGSAPGPLPARRPFITQRPVVAPAGPFMGSSSLQGFFVAARGQCTARAAAWPRQLAGLCPLRLQAGRRRGVPHRRWRGRPDGARHPAEGHAAQVRRRRAHRPSRDSPRTPGLPALACRWWSLVSRASPVGSQGSAACHPPRQPWPSDLVSPSPALSQLPCALAPAGPTRGTRRC